MSLSIRTVVSKKVGHKHLQLNNRLTNFTNPPIYSGDLYVTNDLYVAGKTNLHDLAISGDLSVSENTYLQRTDISENLTVDGNSTFKKDVLSYGTISARQYLPGQIINMVMLSNIEINQINQVNANGTRIPIVKILSCVGPSS